MPWPRCISGNTSDEIRIRDPREEQETGKTYNSCSRSPGKRLVAGCRSRESGRTRASPEGALASHGGIEGTR